MISCRIVMNELPDDVLDEVLCVDEVEEGDARWRPLKKGPAGRTYRYIPRPGGASWFVRWCYQYSWQHLRDSFTGQDEATNDWKKTSAAGRLGIPVTRYRFLGAPRLLTASLDTLLVREYLGDACTVSAYLIRHFENEQGVRDTLSIVGELLASIHRRGMVHGHFVLNSVLMQYADPSRLAVTDWQDAIEVNGQDPLVFEEDLVFLLNDLAHIGLNAGHMQTVLDAYAGRMIWCQGRFDEMLALAAAEPTPV